MNYSSGGFFMFKISFLFSFLLPLVLSGCVAGNLADNPALPLTKVNVAEQKLDGTHIYWYLSRQNAPERLGERVYSTKQGDYQSDYQWQSGKLKTLLQQGERLVDGQQVPFELQLRFDSQGVAVYQRYTEDGQILPLTIDEIAELKQHSEYLVQRIERLKKSKQYFEQGYKQQQQLISCQTQQPMAIDDPNVLSVFDPSGYWAAIGKQKNGKLRINKLLPDVVSGTCLQAPTLIDTKQ
ncbi:DUF1481 domain-containing protein [Photobacterium angustum]|uniref:DUF1481 domain-containing protein n=2 Tax=Photobacterium angustum TaxID=661 RepID=A0A855S749_PHOAN|nr:hypothetical protein UB36_19400 [Photobacterium damselae subsp. damselae]KJG27833.1 hypothetical protein UA69_18260 [Photobacterium angustum]KJG37542.1 hypothetical protein UA35_16835 [Photobacterium angustum]KJG43550.1 hypothetical protein UA31_19405 [Photobacterium angustum]KJG45597.1 hypothetical protein UA30_19205 [Photobacterium angustum]